MEHLAIKAAVAETTDLGEFTAIAAAWSVDRMREQIVPGAFSGTISRWQSSGKRLPLHWNHAAEAENVIGWIDPSTMRETAEGLYVEGRVDIDSSEVAREAWRSMKNGTMSLSFGYVIERQRRRRDGIKELVALDLFEVSVVPAPANRDTRVLSTKSIDVDSKWDIFFQPLEHGHIPTVEQLRAKERALGLGLEAVRDQSYADTLAVLGHEPPEPTRTAVKAVKADDRPIRVASFEC